MTRLVRRLLFAVGAAQAFLAAAFFLRLPAVVDLWPFPGTTPLTFTFVSSIFAAAAASTWWVAATKNYGALAGIGLDYATILVPLAVFGFQLGAASGNSAYILVGAASAVWAAFGLALLAWSIRIPMDRTVPMPALVRWSFAAFVVALVIVSTRLILGVPDSLPWKITPDLSVVIGWMFLGAAAYFAYGLVRPCWVNAAGQLAGFLAYDLVLVVPLLTRVPSAAPEHRAGLAVYLAVIVYSAVLATYYLFIRSPTRRYNAAVRHPTPASRGGP